MRVLSAVGRSKYLQNVKSLKIRRYSSAVVSESKEDAKVEYPEILDISEIPRELRRKAAYYKKIQKLNTVEEKLIALNIARYYGWPSFHLKEGVIPYNFLPFSQFITRTELKEVDELPVYLNNDQTRKLLADIKPELEKVVVFENCLKNFKHEVETCLLEENELPNVEKKNIKTKNLIFQINSVLFRVLHHQYPHIFKTQIDYEPRLEAFWRVGGFHPTKEDKKLRERKEMSETRWDEYIDRFFQYFGSPILQIRSTLPLPEITTLENKVQTSVDENESSSLITSEEKPHLTDYGLQEYRYDPKTYLEIPRERIRGAVIPGFWPNDPYRFGLVSYHGTNYLSERPIYDSQDSKEALHAQAILASYAWAYGQACYQGFSTYYDITYPFTTQTILTDGKIFSFYQYQMNTTVLHTYGTNPENPLKNNCFATLPEELYHDIDGDQIKGWNDKALLHLISMYINAPKERVGVDLCPYLNKDEKLLSQIKDDKRRNWLHEFYQHTASHRPSHRLPPEIYDWERIYKIENKRRVLDARKKFWEKFLDPINDRKMYEYEQYVPKKFRDPAKMKQRYADHHFPNACQDYHDIV
ncbi:large ribosomal subunit protein mL65 [Planococcus citri]|uniref:large ribosomal subunit protein mL65 n=1 Tax=Planococcus citri TaxID=170843 RepID=UPI0031F8C03E